MSVFLISQILVGIAILFDLLSFQFKDRKQIVGCLFCAGILISAHFALLEQWTAASLMAIATTRYMVSIFSTSYKMAIFFSSTSIIATFVTYSGITSLISCLGSVFQTMAAFDKNDKRLRELMIIGTSFWLIHNYLIGSPTAVLMEILFICSNVIGYYRYYLKKNIIREKCSFIKKI